VGDSLPYVEDKIESRCEAFWGFRYSHHQLGAEQTIRPVGRLIGKIKLRREHRPLRSLHFDVIVTSTPWDLKPGGYKIVFMKPKYSVTTIASYDEAILKRLKGPMTDTRPTSSVVRTISE
jgi:hypothetical protein